MRGGLGQVRDQTVEHAAARNVAVDRQMAQRIADHDWTATSLGPRTAWPEALKALVRLMLASDQPMFIAWGPEKTWLYNDAFAPIMGRKHPALLGRPALDEVWREARDDLTPLFDSVFAGQAVQRDDISLMLDRVGVAEESHFSFSYTPIQDEEGRVTGLYGVCTETTALVESRALQAATERELGAAMEEARIAAERVELALRAGAIIGTWVWDIPRDLCFADEQFAASFGLDASACHAGVPISQMMLAIHPDDIDRVAAAIQAACTQGGPYRCDYRVVPADGVARWVEARGQVEMDAAGVAVRFPGALIDIDERRRTAEALAQANHLLRTFMEAVPGVIYAKDIEGRLLVGNRGTANLLGCEFEDFVGRTDAELLEDKDEAAALMANDRRIMDTGVAEQLEERVTLPDGSEAWWHSTKAPLRDPSGRVVGLIGSSVDITERRRSEEHRDLLVNELNHRVKNTLAVVQGLARQTFRGSDKNNVIWDAFESRLIALSRAHNLLTDANWTTANLREIVLDQVALGQPGDRIVIEGPSAELDPSAAVSIALALHELRTNATKYGALSNDTGKVVVSWVLEQKGHWLKLRWEEQGGPPVVAPERNGFGSRLIERALARELGGKVEIDYRASGVVCEINAPVASAVTP